MKSVKYLDLLKEKLGLKNDLALSNHLGWNSGKISQYRNGKRVMDDEACLAIAIALDLNPMEIIGAACLDRAAQTGQKSLWEVFMSRTTATAASAVIAFVTLFVTPEKANASIYKGAFNEQGIETLYYVKLLLGKLRKLRKSWAKLTWNKGGFVTSALEPTAG